jgi:uncharacterized repeat protein (TIGR03803 family)
LFGLQEAAQMKTLALGRHALSVSVAAALLAGCGAGQQPTVNPPGSIAARPNTASETVIYSFAGGSDGADPETTPISLRGELYGTTVNGGNGGCNFVQGCGVAYKVNASGQESVLHVFTSGKDGEAPGSLVAVDGNLFGTTTYGGGYGCKTSRVKGCGTIFELTPSGKESVLYAFRGGAAGSQPNSLTPLQGTLYGEAAAGGTGKCYYADNPGCGLIFKMQSSKHVSVLHAFPGGKNGGAPIGGLLVHDGFFFGTTESGGDNACLFSYGCGTALRVTTTGSVTILHAFGHTMHDGALPEGGLMMLGGMLYGTTFSGGTYDCALTGSFIGCGTVFALTPSGREKIIYNFTGQKDGAYPSELVVIGGNLYGTAGALYGCGTIFELTPSGEETTLYQFQGGSDGCGPSSGLLPAGGVFYGTTSGGGAHGHGTVYAFTP